MLILGGVSIVFALIGLVLPYNSSSLLVGAIASLDALQALSGVILNLVVIIMALVWLHKIHQDLQSLYGTCPITPGGAVARFMIPLYNL
ncbi:hypothetical protein IFO70_13565 [Phormidium tenue FACHB-886]|nr:hypothetical protein [Phormidium tenue FACHB-886]